MPRSRSRRRRHGPSAGSESMRVKPRGPFSIFGNVKLFYFIGAVVMFGSLLPFGLQGVGVLTGASSAHSNNDFVLPEDGQESGIEDEEAVTSDASDGAEDVASIRTYDGPPFFSIDPSRMYVARVRTDAGDIVFRLRHELAPTAVSNFVFLARDGFYDQGLTFHYVVPGFVAQTGDPTGSGRGNAGYDLPLETPSDAEFGRGTVALANSSQFFFTLSDQPQLAGRFAPIGEVTEGLDVLQSLSARNPGDGTAAPAVRVLGVELIEEG